MPHRLPLTRYLPFSARHDIKKDTSSPLHSTETSRHVPLVLSLIPPSPPAQPVFPAGYQLMAADDCAVRLYTRRPACGERTVTVSLVRQSSPVSVALILYESRYSAGRWTGWWGFCRACSFQPVWCGVVDADFLPSVVFRPWVPDDAAGCAYRLCSSGVLFTYAVTGV